MVCEYAFECQELSPRPGGTWSWVREPQHQHKTTEQDMIALEMFRVRHLTSAPSGYFGIESSQWRVPTVPFARIRCLRRSQGYVAAKRFRKRVAAFWKLLIVFQVPLGTCKFGLGVITGYRKKAQCPNTVVLGQTFSDSPNRNLHLSGKTSSGNIIYGQNFNFLS